jgi:hypothetical protein
MAATGISAILGRLACTALYMPWLVALLFTQSNGASISLRLSKTYLVSSPDGDHLEDFPTWLNYLLAGIVATCIIAGGGYLLGKGEGRQQAKSRATAI